MIHEFALDPEAIADWPSFRYIVDNFGVQKGRLISKFPKGWIRLVHEASSGATTMEKHRITESLSQIKVKMISAGRTYDPSETWIDNAKTSHAANPFRLIVSTSEKANHPNIVDADTLVDETPSWNVDCGPVPRNAQSLANAARGLVQCSKVLVFVDPHFSCAARHLKPLEAILRLVPNLKSCQRIEYHLARGAASDEYFESKLKDMTQLQSILADSEMRFYRWVAAEKGDVMHPRYVMSERGGLRFDYGLDEGKEGETTDVSRLSKEEHRIRYAQYCATSTVFQLADSWSISGAGERRLS